MPPEQVYFRCHPQFETASPTLAWATSRLELVHISAAIGVDARQQRHNRAEIGKVRPVDEDARRTRHRNPVDEVVG